MGTGSYNSKRLLSVQYPKRQTQSLKEAAQEKEPIISGLGYHRSLSLWEVAFEIDLEGWMELQEEKLVRGCIEIEELVQAKSMKTGCTKVRAIGIILLEHVMCTEEMR